MFHASSPTSPFPLFNPYAIPHSNLDSCSIDCLDYDAFRFPGANKVTTVTMQRNDYDTLPEELLWNMESMLYLYARSQNKLTGLPERFFLNQSQLLLAFFSNSYQLGAQGLPDGLLKGLTSLMYLSFDYCSIRNMPNLDDLTALVLFYAQGPTGNTDGFNGQWHMPDEESYTKFDSLVSTTTLYITNQKLTRIPSLKNMGVLQTLNMNGNKIPGSLRGTLRELHSWCSSDLAPTVLFPLRQKRS